jgi:hypothetical protein
MPFLNSVEYTYAYNSTSVPPISNNLVLYLAPSTYIGSGTTWDNPINSTDAILTNSPTFVSGRGFTFNGSTQYGTIQSVSGITDFTSSQKYTIEIWCYINSNQADTRIGDNDILEKWNRNNEARYPYVVRFIRASSPPNVVFASYNGASNPSTSIPANLNNWAQYVGVFNHTDMLSVYKNGVFVNSTSLSSLSGTDITNTSPLYLARRANSIDESQNLFTGTIGIVRIYDTAMNASQVSQNFNANRGIYSL